MTVVEVVIEHEPSVTVIVSRARWERMLTVAEAAYEWANAPYNPALDGGELWAAAESALVRAADALHPGDFDPLP